MSIFIKFLGEIAETNREFAPSPRGDWEHRRVTHNTVDDVLILAKSCDMASRRSPSTVWVWVRMGTMYLPTGARPRPMAPPDQAKEQAMNQLMEEARLKPLLTLVGALPPDSRPGNRNLRGQGRMIEGRIFRTAFQDVACLLAKLLFDMGHGAMLK